MGRRSGRLRKWRGGGKEEDGKRRDADW